MTSISDRTAPLESTILILDDGRILARNVTPQLARILINLNPDDRELALRAALAPESERTCLGWACKPE